MTINPVVNGAIIVDHGVIKTPYGSDLRKFCKWWIVSIVLNACWCSNEPNWNDLVPCLFTDIFIFDLVRSFLLSTSVIVRTRLVC